MPVYNAGGFLQDSVISILDQSYADFEFLILNDGSSDQSLEIARGFAAKDNRIVVFNENENRGIVYQLNKGLAAAKGEYIARMDADDISLPIRFTTQLDFIEKNNLDICGSNVFFFSGDPAGNKTRSHMAEGMKEGLAQMFFRTPLLHPTVMFRRSLVEKTGLAYKAEFYPAEDYELWTKTLPYCSFANIHEPLLLYRHSQNQISKTRSALQSEKTIRAKALYIQAMCGFTPSDEEEQLLSDYFYRSAYKVFSENEMNVLFSLFKKILQGLKEEEVQYYFCKYLHTSVSYYSSKRNFYYSNYKKFHFDKYYNGNLRLRLSAMMRQLIK